MICCITGGTGKQGSGLALRWARAGVQVLLGSRDAAKAVARAAELSAKAGAPIEGRSQLDAASAADVVVLSVPYAAHAQTIDELRPVLAGKRILDVVVPLDPKRVFAVNLPPGLSAAMEAQAALPGVPVASALHHVSSVHLQDPDHPLTADVLVCSDDPAWLAGAADLVSKLGCRTLDAGPLRNSIAIESFTSVLLHLNKRYKVKSAGLKIDGI
jgi:hypothetical protein